MQQPASPFIHLSNPLVTSAQLIKFKNYAGGAEAESESESIHFAQAVLTQAAGVLLRLPQDVIATALVLLQRSWIDVKSNGSGYADVPKSDAKTISAAAIYTTAKCSATPLSPRSIINVYAYLSSRKASPLWFVNPDSDPSQSDTAPNLDPDPSEFYISEGTYERQKAQLFSAETQFLYTIGFDMHVALPHRLALTYLRTLVSAPPERLSIRVYEHLNGALLSPQLLYLTHQPNALAVAAIYLAAKETATTKLVEQNWWEVFDVDREDLGFLVLALGSLANFAEAEKAKWIGKVIPLNSPP